MDHGMSPLSSFSSDISWPTPFPVMQMGYIDVYILDFHVLVSNVCSFFRGFSGLEFLCKDEVFKYIREREE